jgi:hypothetical protein
MTTFLSEDFLLQSATARTLYLSPRDPSCATIRTRLIQ